MVPYIYTFLHSPPQTKNVCLRGVRMVPYIYIHILVYFGGSNGAIYTHFVFWGGQNAAIYTHFENYFGQNSFLYTHISGI